MACLQDDNFTGSNGDPPDTTKWTEVDANNLLDIQSNKLNFSDAGGSARTADITSIWKFTGDFNISIAFSITELAQPSQGLGWLGIRVANLAETVSCEIVRYKNSAGANKYASWGSTTAWGVSEPLAAASGWIRLSRSGSTVTGWIYNAQWEWGGNVAGRTFAETLSGDVKVRLRVSKPWSIPDHTINVNFDDFKISGGCPGWVGIILGVDSADISEIMGVAIADIAEVGGV